MAVYLTGPNKTESEVNVGIVRMRSRSENGD